MPIQINKLLFKLRYTFLSKLLNVHICIILFM